MAITLSQTKVGSQTNNSPATFTLQFPSNTTSGNLIIASGEFGNASAGSYINSITDTNSNTYVLGTFDHLGEATEVWYAANISGGTTPIVTFNLAANGTIARQTYLIREYSGLQGSNINVFDIALPSNNAGAVTGGTTGTIVNTPGSILLFAAFGIQAKGTFGLDSTFTNGTGGTDGGGITMAVWGDKIISGTTPNFGTCGFPSGKFSAAICAFRDASFKINPTLLPQGMSTSLKPKSI